MFETLKNAWKIPDLRKKILFTLFILLIYRLGSVITVPFINVQAFAEYYESELANTLFGMLNIFSGSAFSKATMFAMSISPYINASIIMQLLSMAIPALERMVKEGGEEGQKKIASITRYVTVGLGVVMGFSFFITLNNLGLVTYDAINLPRWLVGSVIVLSFTAGTSLIMWLGEQITEFGIGNGISIILFTGIISGLPTTIMTGYYNIQNGSLNVLTIAIIMALALLTVVFVVFMQNAERRIPVQYAKRVVGRKMYGGQSTYIPLKITMSGVMPIIFASSFVSLPATIFAFIPSAKEHAFWGQVYKWIGVQSPLYMALYFILIIGFSFFYSTMQFNPIEMANNLKKNGGFVPGLRPGKPTSDFISKSMSRIVFIGAIFLGLIACFPYLIGVFYSGMGGYVLGGTTVLIVTGVALETVTQLESQMLMRHYKGFLE